MDVDALDGQAREIMRANSRGGYTVPTHGLYPYQWNWDSMFAAWGFAQFDLDRAWAEVETLLAGQWPDGMVPHILFHQVDPGYFPGPDVWGTAGCGPVPSSGISQPPVAASFVWRLTQQDPNRAEAAQAYDRLLAWHRWFMEWRQAHGVIFVTHPWESGRDNAFDWDIAMAAINPVDVGDYTRRDTSHVDASMRPTKAQYDRYLWLVQRGRAAGWDASELAKGPSLRVAEPGMTFILLAAHRDLARLGQALGRDVSEVEGWIATMEAGVDWLWNPAIKAYDSRDIASEAFSNSLSNASFLCWYAGVDNAEMLDQLDRITAASRYPVPSYDPEAQGFDSRRYWRGPTWAMLNALVSLGLAAQGHAQRAEALRQSTADLIADHGFAEYFDPLDGAPAGGQSFTWTAAVWLAWASPTAGEIG